MVGPGTGIAPFRGFWQERSSHDKKKLGKAVLFFGCRTPDDYLYKQEIEQAQSEGAVSDVFVAYSRLGGATKKAYVQQTMTEQQDLVWDLLTTQSAVLYVCGDVGMSKDVEDTLKQILQDKGMTILESAQYVEDLRKHKRYLMDVFGTTLHVKKQLSSQRNLAMHRMFKSSKNLLTVLASTKGMSSTKSLRSAMTSTKSLHSAKWKKRQLHAVVPML